MSEQQMKLPTAPAALPPMAVVQLPIIQERLRDIRADVLERTNRVKSLVCSPETLRDVKQERAALRAEFEKLEAQRKDIKKMVMAPYEEFDAVYQECISDAFNAADNDLKGKITAVEDGIKKQCEERLFRYFSELCTVNHLDFLRWEQAKVKVDMASAQQKTPKKLMSQVNEFVQRVADNVSMISGMESAEEIMVEYKRTLNATAAISTVRERHSAIALEAEERRKRDAAQEVDMGAAAKVDAVCPPVFAPASAPAADAVGTKVYQAVFKVTTTKEKLIKLREFMKQEEISYECSK